jgi:hypothetical protein
MSVGQTSVGQTSVAQNSRHPEGGYTIVENPMHEKCCKGTIRESAEIKKKFVNAKINKNDF